MGCAADGLAAPACLLAYLFWILGLWLVGVGLLLDGGLFMVVVVVVGGGSCGEGGEAYHLVHWH